MMIITVLIITIISISSGGVAARGAPPRSWKFQELEVSKAFTNNNDYYVDYYFFMKVMLAMIVNTIYVAEVSQRAGLLQGVRLATFMGDPDRAEAPGYC